jgi:hypothetical protein
VVSLRDAATGKPLPQSPDLSGVVSGLTFSADGGRLLAQAGERWLSWELSATVPAPRPTPLAKFACLAPGGRVAVRPDSFNRADAPAEFIDPVSGKPISRFDPPETGETVVISRGDRGGVFSGDARRYVGFRRTPRGPGGQQTELGLAVWDVASGKRVVEWPGGKTMSLVAAVSPDGKAVAVLSVGPGDSRLTLWEPDSGRTRWARAGILGVPSVVFSRRGSWLVLQEFHRANLGLTPVPPSPMQAGPLLVLDTATGKELMKVSGPAVGLQHQRFADETYYPVPMARAVAPDGRTAAFSWSDGTISLWELATDRERCRLAHPGPVHELAFSPDSRLLAAASLAAPVVVYDLYGTRAAPKTGPKAGSP